MNSPEVRLILLLAVALPAWYFTDMDSTSRLEAYVFPSQEGFHAVRGKKARDGFVQLSSQLICLSEEGKGGGKKH